MEKLRNYLVNVEKEYQVYSSSENVSEEQTKKRKKRGKKRKKKRNKKNKSDTDSSDSGPKKLFSRSLLQREGLLRDSCDMPPYCMGPCRSGDRRRLPAGLEVFGPPPPPLGERKSGKKVRTQEQGEIAVSQKLCEMEPKCSEPCAGRQQAKPTKRRVFRKFRMPRGDLTARISEICYSLCRESCIMASNLWHRATKELTTFEQEHLPPRLQAVLLKSLSQLTLPIEEESPDDDASSISFSERGKKKKKKKKKKGKRGKSSGDSDSSTSDSSKKKKKTKKKKGKKTKSTSEDESSDASKKKKKKKGKKSKGSKSGTESTDSDYESDSSSSKKGKIKKKKKK